MLRGTGFFVLIALLCLVGCDQQTAKSPESKAEAKTETKPAPAQEAPKMPPAADKAALEKLGKAYEAAKKEAEAAKDDKAKKDAYIKATMAYGDGYLTAAEVPPKEKYKKALELYREAYKADPATKEAKSNIDMIEGIYKSMGKEIPQ